MMGGFGGEMMGGYGHGFGGGYGGLGGFGGGFGWAGIIGMALQSLFWIALIVAAVYLIRRWSHGHRMTHNSAVNILDDRFARGEITSEEYKKMKKDLLS